MSNRKGYQYLTVIVPETTYGTPVTALTSAPIVLVCSAKADDLHAKIDLNQKTGTLEPLDSQALEGLISGKIELSGELVDPAKVLYPAICGDNTMTTPFYLRTAQGTNYSYTIYQIFSTDNKATKVTGCVLEKCVISGNAGEAIKFTGSFRAKQTSYEQTHALQVNSVAYTPSLPVIGLRKAFLFQSATGTACADMLNFSLSITNKFQDDKAIYRNSQTKKEELIIGTEIELSYEKIYDTSDTVTYTGSPASNTLILTDGTHTHTITVYGQTVARDIGDPENGVLTSKLTLRGAGDGTNKAINIATA